MKAILVAQGKPPSQGTPRRCIGAAFAALWLITPCAMAEHPGGVESMFSDDLPIVLTASRLVQPQNEAPAAVTIIDAELIRATGYRDIARLLRLAPGMQIGQERGHSHWVTYHGLGNDYPSWMQVLVDGRSVFSPGNFDGVDWNSLLVGIDEIERIEVVRGTNSAAYGSNAVLGVVNIITRHSDDAAGKQIGVKVGNAGIRDASAELSTAFGETRLRINASTRHDLGFDKLNDSRRNSMATLRSDVRLGDRDTVMLRLGVGEGWRGLGYPDSTFNNNAERQADFGSAALHAQWRHAEDGSEEWQLNLYRNQDRVREAWFASTNLLPPAAPGVTFVPLDRNRTSTRDSLELQHRRAWNATWQTVWGAEMRRDSVHGPFLYAGAPDQHTHLGRLFGNAEWWVAPSVSLNASGLLEKHEQDAARLSPRLFANWRAGANDTWRIGYARAWRQPFLFERYGDVQARFNGVLLVQPYLPNPGLDASRMDSAEIGYLKRLPDWKSTLDVRLFRERISKYIYRQSRPEHTAPVLSSFLPSATYENLGSPVVLQGLEYQIDGRPWAGGRVLLSHALIGRESDDPKIAALTAPYSGSLTWIQEWGGRWSTTLTALRMGAIAGGSGFVAGSSYASPAYTTADLRIARSFHADALPIEVALVGTNLGGRHQEIADRSQQAVRGATPANPTSPMAWLTLTVRQ